MKEEQIFQDAIEQPVDKRTAFLLDACGCDVALRERVEVLLKAHANPGSFLGSPAAEFAARTMACSITEKPGTIIGPYKLLQQIGEGGMGVVFMAEQTEPLKRTVALKIIKPGMDTRQAIARFEAERQAVAMMDHPNIAKVLDAGATDSGRLYFVMELVKGVSIIKYCDEKQLPLRERLKLFVQVCQAVQHAHQKGLIHRDIKPTNVLVAEYDERAVPKVIDFGVAKATAQKLTERTMFTEFGQVLGTMEYMSPEQAKLNQLDIDTRSDIYSLGVLLYELLTGSTPFARKRLQAAAFDEMLRIIREEEPPKPSTRLSTSAELQSIAASRGMAPNKLRGLIRGDLDWVVMKALDKDRNRRYDSANVFAADVQRYLNDEAVQAGPPSATYRFRKFARRNKAALVMATFVGSALLLAVAGLAVSTVLIAQEQQATENALHAETLAKADLQKTLDRERRDSYFHRITLAHRELSVDNLGRALQLLGECPEDLREWEWHYLMRLCRVEPVILRDAAEIRSVAFLPNGNQVAAACGNGTVKVFDAKTGKLIQTLRGHAEVFSLAISRDSRHLASASTDKTVQLWDMATGREVFQFPGHIGEYAGMTNAVTFSPDSRHLVVGGEDGFATVWDATDGSQIHRLSEKHENTATCAAFSPDGNFLATGSWGGVLRIWDARTGQLLHQIPGHKHRISAVVFRHDSQGLATASFDRTVKIWEAATGGLLHTLRGHTGVISGLAFSHGGRRLFSVGGEDKTLKVWDLRTDQEVLNLRGHTLFCHSLAASPDGNRLASAGKDGTIRIWDATPVMNDEGRECLACEHGDEVWSVQFSPDGTYLASASWGDRTVRIWDGRTGIHQRDLTLRPSVSNLFHVAFSPDGKRLAAAAVSRDWEAVVNVWETATGREALDEIRELRSVPFFVTFDPSGRYLIREGPEHVVQVRDAQTGKEVGVIGRHSMQIWAMTFSPDGHHLATASNDGTVQVWAWDPSHLVTERQPQFTLDVHADGYGDRVAFSRDSQRLATGGELHTVNIWDATTGELQHTLRGHTGDVFAIAFSCNSRWLATAGEDTTVRIWDTASWKLQHTLRGHTGLVMSLAFSPDSQRLASGSRDHTMRVWDTSRWEKLSDD
jgi:WD40 repeat protein/serine/threonine protein kinase